MTCQFLDQYSLELQYLPWHCCACDFSGSMFYSFRWTLAAPMRGGRPLVASIYLEAGVNTINFEGMRFVFLGLVWPVLVNAGSYGQRCHAELKYVSQERVTILQWEYIIIVFQLGYVNNYVFFNKYDNSHFKNSKDGTLNWM
jgi:hypothetical protein